MKFLKLHFAELICMDVSDTGGGEGNNSSNEDGNANENNNANNTGENHSGEKMFSQAELNSILANEKRKNAASFHESLGFKSVDEAKEFVKKYKELEEQNKDDLVKEQEKNALLAEEKEAEQQKARRAEYKLKLIEQGCSVQMVEDMATLAINKLGSDEDFETVLKGLKESYPGVFKNLSEHTGSGGNPPRKPPNGSDASGIGKRLAEQRKNGIKNAKNNPFFTN